MQRVDPQRIFVRAKSLADRGKFQKALPLFADLLKSGNRGSDRFAQILSYYGLSLAMVQGANREGLRCCEEAARRLFFHPEIYLNLGKLYLKKGDRRKAIRAIRRGLGLDPENRHLLQALVSMGMRRLPLLPFLSRSNYLNRYLGRVTSQIGNLFGKSTRPPAGADDG